MKRRAKFGLTVLLAIALVPSGGCVDGVRQTIAPYLFSGLQTIADGMITSDNTDNSSLAAGAQTIADGLIAGMQRAVYPKG